MLGHTVAGVPALIKAAASAGAPGRWTSAIGAGLEARIGVRAGRLSDVEFWRSRTAALQRRQLRNLLRAARHTEFGRTRGFTRLARLPLRDLARAYREATPVADWYAFAPLIQRMREGGEPDLLWPGLVRDFAQTSGTTAGDKFIPVSRQMLRSNFRASLDIFGNLTRFGMSLPWLLGGKCLFLGGSSDVRANEHGIRTGDLSGLVTPLIRWPLSEVYLPGHDIALMDHWPTKIGAMARACIDEDVRMISGMCSWGLVLFEAVLQLARAQGRQASCVRDVWPNLDLFVHGGVKYAPFLPRVNRVAFGDERTDFPFRIELYPASEGFIAIQDTPGEPGLRLCSDIGVYYEFVPLEDIDTPGARAFTCDEVERGQKYVVVMSTCAGLWRYIIGDVVEFDDIPGAFDGAHPGTGPCRLRIVGRHRHFINAFGENLIVEHIENAVADAARAAGLTVGEFTAAPVYPGGARRAGLELAAEFEGPCPQEGTIARFALAFDASLKAQNVDYTTKRTDGLGMAPPTVTPLPLGAFHRWMGSRGKLGGQHKCPRCANHREIIEGVIGLTGR